MDKEDFNRLVKVLDVHHKIFKVTEKLIVYVRFVEKI